MSCELMYKPRQTPLQRKAEVQKSLATLRAKLATGLVRVVVGKNGAVAFVGWDASERDGVSDACAYRALTRQNSAELRAAVTRAEGLAGVKVNERVVASGVHSHDGGKTWGPGHGH